MVSPAPSSDRAPAASRPARLRVGVISAGRVGSVLGAALSGAGHHVVAAAAVSRASLRRAERFLPDTPIRPADQVAAASELLLLAVPDDELPGLVGGLAAARVVRPGCFVVHTSGAFGIDVLQPLTDRGALPLALHPVMTFAGGAEDLARVNGACFGVTAPDELRPVGETLVVELGAEPVWVAEAARPLYHAGLCLAANSVVSLVAEVSDLLGAAGVEAPTRLLAPLLGAALDNALRRGDAALTGPVARGDAGVVARHLEALADAGPDAAGAYRALSRLTASRALGSGMLGHDAAERLLGVLGDPGGTP
jgi:predicted short-subunit dehydrogenase-like oxidoreductase (DUF2520 family)